MPVNWIDVRTLSFNCLLLLERVQLVWLPDAVPESDLAVALAGNPVVEWYMRRKCPPLEAWLDSVLTRYRPVLPLDAETLRKAELAVLQPINDWLVYVMDPMTYDLQPFLNWNSRELTDLVDFADQTVIDVGAGTGRLTLIAAATAQAVFAVEPITNLRFYLKQIAVDRGYANVYAVDGLITAIPFPDGFAGVTMGGHVFGDRPAEEFRELVRVTRPGGMVILCPGNGDVDNAVHAFLVEQGCQWGRFEEPGDGMKRKYWKRV
jgi:SAM-dependent methyltransferase